MINVKLDKTGGLTEALRLSQQACENGFKLLIGCMVGTSLSIAPARLLASAADYVDLDGLLLLAKDGDHALTYENNRIGLPSRQLWVRASSALCLKSVVFAAALGVQEIGRRAVRRTLALRLA